jgi:hypothetical protein
MLTFGAIGITRRFALGRLGSSVCQIERMNEREERKNEVIKYVGLNLCDMLLPSALAWFSMLAATVRSALALSSA